MLPLPSELSEKGELTVTVNLLSRLVAISTQKTFGKDFLNFLSKNVPIYQFFFHYKK